VNTPDKTSNSTATGGILIVDDNADDVKLLSNILMLEGFSVRPASDGALALRSVRARLPDLILLYIQLSEMDGFEVCRRLKADPETCEIPVIFISALHDAAEKEKAFSAGGIDYISKPLQEGEILARVRIHLSIVRSSRALTVERDRAQQYLDFAGVILVALDMEGAVSLINRKGCDVLGAPHKEIIGKNWFQHFLPPAGRQEVLEVFEQIIAGQLEAVEYFENSVLTRDGRERIVAWHNSPVRDGSGAITGVLSSGEDITERKRAEEELRRSEERFHLAALASSDLIYEWHVADDTLEWFGDIEDVLGYKSGEIPRSVAGWVELIHPEDRVLLSDAVERHRTSTAPINYGYRVKAADGTWRSWTDSGMPVLDDRGRPVRWVGACLDITERKRVEDALRQSEEKLRTAFESTSDCILIWDHEYNCLYANQAAIDHVGTTADKVIGKNIRDGLGHVPDFMHLWMNRIDHVFATGEKVRVQDETLMQGRRFFTDSIMSPIRTPDGDVTAVCVTYRDVTEIMRLEDALRESEETQRILLNNLNAGVVAHAPDTSVTFANPAACQLLGLSEEQMKGTQAIDPSWKFLNDDNSEMLVGDYPVNRVLSAKGPLRNKIIGICHPGNGNVVWVLANGYSALDDSGQVEQVVVSFVDITERKQAEDQLRNSREQLDLALSGAEAGTWSWNIKTGEDILDERWCGILGYRKEEVKQEVSSWENLIHPDEKKRIFEVVQQHFDNESNEYRHEYRMKCKNGEWKWILALGKVVERDAEGAPARMTGIIVDINMRKQAEDALKESESRLSLALSGANQGTWDWNIKTDEVVYSERWTGMLGYEVGELVPNISTWESLMHPEDEDRVMQELNRHFEDDAVRYESEFRLKSKSGEWKWIGARGKVFERDEDNKPLRMVGTHIDITERKRVAREKAELAAKLIQQQRLESIGTLASGVAHEINNPINGVINYAQLIVDESGDGTTVGGYAREIITETNRVASIVRSLLQFSRQDNQSHSPALISDIVEATLSLIRTIIRHDQITLQVDVPDSLPKLKCRSQQIRQVLMNLLTNARDALNERFPEHDEQKTIAISASLIQRDGRRWIRVLVQDQGAGISPDVMDRILDPFFTSKGRNLGTGLGLSIAHGFVKEHHGRLTFESKLGQGTTVCLELPVDNGWSLDDGTPARVE
jgi:PAS domain S-box-containing protein